MVDTPDRLKIHDRGQGDLVTNLDRQIEQLIIYQLGTTYPDHAFLGKESGLTGPQDADHLWIIDPLDGTENFIQGVPHLCISLACQIRGEVEHGVIFDPLRNEEFVASRGRGSHLGNHRCRVQEQQDHAAGLLATNRPASHQAIAHFMMMARVSQGSAVIRQTGSAALDLAYVAAGRFQGSWMTGLRPWNLAAGALLIREAGGRISDLDGEAGFQTSGQLICGSPGSHRMLLAHSKELFQGRKAETRRVKRKNQVERYQREETQDGSQQDEDRYQSAESSNRSDWDDNQETENPGQPDLNGNQETENSSQPDLDSNQETENPGQPDLNGNQETENSGQPDLDSNQEPENSGQPDLNGNQETETPGQPDLDDNQETENSSQPDLNDNQETENSGQPDLDSNQETENSSQPDLDSNQETENPDQPDLDDNQETETPDQPDLNGNQETETPDQPDLDR